MSLSSPRHSPTRAARHGSAYLRFCALLCGGIGASDEARAQAQEGASGDEAVAWISEDQHQRVIMPRLHAPHPAQEASPTAPTEPTAQRVDGATEALERVFQQRPVARPSGSRGGNLRHAFTPEMQAMLERASRHYAVDKHLVKAVIHAESAFNPRAVSPKNAIGLMQVLPSTARDLGLSAMQGMSLEQLMTDPRVSIVLGTKYLAEQLARFGDVELAVAAYNAGPGAVIKAGRRVPNYRETQHYVRRVMHLTQAYRRAALQGDPA